MTIGPVQLIVVGFDNSDFHAEIADELQRLRDNNAVRVIDGLAVHKDDDGNIEVARLSNLTADEAIEVGSTIGALVGLGIDGSEEGIEAGAEAGAENAAEGNLGELAEEEVWDVLADIPNGTSAAMVLLEHHWAVPLRDAIARAGGFRLSDDFIHPEDLVAIGLLAREDAEEHALDKAAS